MPWAYLGKGPSDTVRNAAVLDAIYKKVWSDPCSLRVEGRGHQTNQFNLGGKQMKQRLTRPGASRLAVAWQSPGSRLAGRHEAQSLSDTGA